MGKIVQIQSPVKANLDMMIDKLAPAMNRGSIIIVHPSTWDELMEELVLAGDDDTSWMNNEGVECSYKNITVYRSSDYPVGQWGIYL